jgi:hypothetical protein
LVFHSSGPSFARSREEATQHRLLFFQVRACKFELGRGVEDGHIIVNVDEFSVHFRPYGAREDIRKLSGGKEATRREGEERGSSLERVWLANKGQLAPSAGPSSGPASQHVGSKWRFSASSSEMNAPAPVSKTAFQA